MANNSYTVTGNTVIDDTETLWGNKIQYNTLLFAGYQGVNYAYYAGGATAPGVYTDAIERFPFAASTTNSADVGNLTGIGSGMGGVSTAEYGYGLGGYRDPIGANLDQIQRYQHVATGDSADTTANLTRVKQYTRGASSSTYGYALGGIQPNTPSPGSTYYTDIDRFPFASSTTNATDIGDLIVAKNSGSTQQSSEYAYYSGGTGASTYTDVERFPFASDTPTSADVGDVISPGRFSDAGCSSLDYGYHVGGRSSPTVVYNFIGRFPFSTTGFTTADVGDLGGTRTDSVSHSSTEYGYSTGGYNNPPILYHDDIMRWPFASALTNSTTIGLATSNRLYASPSQF